MRLQLVFIWGFLIGAHEEKIGAFLDRCVTEVAMSKKVEITDLR